jgi:hypothetical protein
VSYASELAGLRQALELPTVGELRRSGDLDRLHQLIETSHLLLEPALTTPDLLVTLTKITDTPLLPFSVSGEYNALDLTLQIELFTALKRAGAARITYAAADIAETLHDSGRPTTTRNALPL